eukprot:maker-scaffold435_size171904-snap-gene-0.27 protein:Tk07244 transcript:maker-scaffold435_size171904-snap-gene-0.27-mRNA-1 annotation:"hypothetical protein DAPPUDRAFT_39815"
MSRILPGWGRTLSNLIIPQTPQCSGVRFMAARARKRFYKNVAVVSSAGPTQQEFELTLDNRKLKTPMGKEFRVTNEILAHAVATEWNAQKEYILLSQMHLTGLANVCIDQPTKARKEDLVDSILNFLDTDTVLFFGGEEELLSRQRLEWQPIIDWFCERHGVEITPSSGLEPPTLSPGARETIRKHLLSYNYPAINGFSFGVDAVKSLVLLTALVDRRLTVDEAVKLSRLETQVQIESWGNVEWAHDIELHDTTARAAAATIFVQLSSSEHLTREKDIQQS